MQDNHQGEKPFLLRCTTIQDTNLSFHKLLHRSQALLAIDANTVMAQDLFPASVNIFILTKDIENDWWNEIPL
jgi:hypothetical protein